jgi:glycosyltransferase involved in cell wall biosynthesis
MKVLWLTNTPSKAIKYLDKTDSSGGWISSLEDELAESGIQLGIAFYWQYSKTIKVENRQYFAIKKNLKRKLTGYFNLGSTNLFDSLVPFIDVIKTFKPDVIHVHGTEMEFGLIQEKVTNIPIVISIQGSPLVISQKFFSGFPKSFIRLNQFIKGLYLRSYYDDYRRFVRKGEIEKQILHKCKFVIGRTQWDKLVTKILAPNAQYFHVDEIMRSGFYENSWNKSLNGDFKIISVMRDNLYKGLETIFYASSLLRSKNINYKWLIAGISETDSIVKLAEKLTSQKFKDLNITLLGDKNEGELIQAYLESSLFVQASHIENSPNGLSEAMILGMPIITTFAGGTSSLINDDEGIIVQDGDAYVMAGAIQYCLENFDSVIEKGKKAKVKALKRHNKQNILRSLLEVYASCNSNI